MPCSHKLDYVSAFEPGPTLDPLSENVFGAKCQFTNFAENDLITVDNQRWCPFHAPLREGIGFLSTKGKWSFVEQAFFSSLLAEWVRKRVDEGKPIDLSGLVHWDRLTLAMVYVDEGSAGTTRPLPGCPSISLDSAIFPRGVDFRLCEFTGTFYARKTAFNSQADFSGVNFRSRVDFALASFSGEVNFCQSVFLGDVALSGVAFGGAANFSGAKFMAGSDFSARSNVAGFFSGPEVKRELAAANFQICEFHGQANFNDRIFVSGPDFEGATFGRAPTFHGSQFHQSVNFDGAKFEDIESPGADRAYRTLKLAMNSLNAREEEALFFSFEQRARSSKPSAGMSMKIVSRLYWDASNYGMNFMRPLALMVSFNVFMFALYSCLLTPAGNGMPAAKMAIILGMQQVVHPFSVWGFGYFSHLVSAESGGGVSGVVKFAIRLLGTVQSLVTVALVALSLFAMRRRFRIN